MKRYLFVTFEGGGNVPAVLGAARRMVDRGHDVRILTEPCLRGAVEGIGARFASYRESFLRTDRREDLIVDWKRRTPPGQLASTLETVVYGPAAATAADVARAVDAERPDVLVVDWLLPAAIAVGEARGLPTAVLVHSISMLPGPGRPAGPATPARGPLGRLRDAVMWSMFRRLVDRHRHSFNAMRAQLGLDPLPRPMAQYERASRVLVQTSAGFDFLASPEPEHRVYVGPVLDDPDWACDVAWEPPWPADDPRPLVVLSLSSTFQNQRAVLQSAIDALGRCEVRGLVTLGPAMADASFDLPANVVAVDAAPHSGVFPEADAFITHCGHGSVMRALAHGLPLVALPMGRDQDGVAARVVHHGLGLQPRRSPAAIAKALRRVLAEPRFRTAARAMAERLHQERAADPLGAELDALGMPAASRPAAPALTGPSGAPR